MSLSYLEILKFLSTQSLRSMKAALTLVLQVLYPDMHPDKQQVVDGQVDEMKRSSIVSHIKFPEWGSQLMW